MTTSVNIKPFLKLRLHVVLGDSSPPLSLLADMLS